jgi:hypothetical protein
LGTVGAAAKHEQVDHETDQTVEARHHRIIAALDHADQLCAKPQVNASG